MIYRHHSARVIHKAPVIHHAAKTPSQVVVKPVKVAKKVTPKAQLVVEVPSAAKVKLLGKLMTKTGTTRSWTVPLHKANTEYNYTVSVQLGEQSLTQEITIAADDEKHLRFGLTDGVLVADYKPGSEKAVAPAQKVEAPRARLVLNVPENAGVTLKGQKMAGTGKVRVWNVPVTKANVDYRYQIGIQVGDQTLAHTTIVRADKTTSITVSEQDGKLIAETGSSNDDTRLASL